MSHAGHRGSTLRALITPLTAAVFVAAVLAALLVVGSFDSPADAAFPGVNGKIAFRSSRDGNFQIYVVNADGSGQINLSNNPVGDVDPNWSPDGLKIVFASRRDGIDQIYVMNADGSGQAKLSNNAAYGRSPDWQPLGASIPTPTPTPPPPPISTGTPTPTPTSTATPATLPSTSGVSSDSPPGLLENGDSVQVGSESNGDNVGIAALAGIVGVTLIAAGWYARKRWMG